MSYRIFITGSGIVTEAQERLKAAHCTFETGHPTDTPEDIAKKLKAFDPHGLIVRQGKITDKVMGAAKNLKVICKHGVGTDNIDIDAATRRGIPVMYTPRANFESVATHAFALMLALVRTVPFQDRQVRMGVFDKKSYHGQELTGKTLGLIGFGLIGRRLSELVAPFQMKVRVYHPSHKTETLPGYVSKVTAVSDIYAGADIISLHCPLTPDTKNLIDREAMACMKKGVFLINTARGGIVNEMDLHQALKAGQVGGAALDVFGTEPPPADHPLFTLDNVIATAHVAGLSDNSTKNMGTEAVNNVLAVLNGEPVDPGFFKNSIPGK